MRLPQSIAITIVLCTSALSQAGPAGGVTLQIDTQFERSKDTNRFSDNLGTQKAGLAVDAYGGIGNVGIAVFIDAHFGAGLSGGFAYQFDFLPVGLAFFDRKGAINMSLTAGIRQHGVTGRQAYGVFLPLRLSLNVKLGSYAHVNAWASVDNSLRDSREDGSEHAGFGDELRAGVVIRLGPNRTNDRGKRVMFSGNGYFIGGTYSERFNTQFWGILVGHGMDMGGGTNR